MNKYQKYCLAKKSDELKKLIAENPDLPIVVLASDEANSGDYSWMFCSSVYFSIDEILDCDYTDYDDTVFCDRDRLEEVLYDNMCDDYETTEELDQAVKEKMEELEPYWVKVISIWAGN